MILKRHCHAMHFRSLQVVPQTRRTSIIIGDRAFAVAGPRAWNSLPLNLQIVLFLQKRT